MNRWVNRTQGFAIIGMIFILVILAVSGAYMVKMGASNVTMVDLTLIEIRAYYAARSALEIAREQWEKDHLCPKKTISFNEQNGTLKGFEVNFLCDPQGPSSENPHFNVLHIKAIAKKGQWGERDYVSKPLSQWFITE